MQNRAALNVEVFGCLLVAHRFKHCVAILAPLPYSLLLAPLLYSLLLMS